MMTSEELKPVESNVCPVQTAEMDFLIAQKMMYQVTTVVWPQPYDGSNGRIFKRVYEMTLSDFLEHFSVGLDKNAENIIAIKPI